MIVTQQTFSATEIAEKVKGCPQGDSLRPTWIAASIRAALTQVIAVQFPHGRPNADSDSLHHHISSKREQDLGGQGRTKTIHVHVSPLTVSDATSERAPSALCFTLQLK